MGSSLTRRQMEKSLHAEYRVPKRNPLARHGPWLAVVLGVLVALGAAVFVETWRDNQGAQDAGLKVNAGEAAAAILALGGFPIAYWQWRKGREEASLDALYLRLEHINELMMAAQHPPQIPAEGAPVDARGALARYVFAEVDTLEHTHERYKLGYATTQQLYRVVTRLEDRCRDYHELRDQVAGFLKPGKDAGYYPETRDILRSICRNARGDE